MRKLAVGLAAVAVFSATIAVAQPDLPRENHYSVYQVVVPMTHVEPVMLTDQFGTIPAFDFVLERFANPAEKIHPETGDVFPIVDPFIHQTWWRLSAGGASRTIVGIDQFGIERWTLGNPVYLLNPTLKDVPGGEPPVWNHYLCYEGVRVPLSRPVILIDQFGTSNVVVLEGRWFCNPVEKMRLNDGRVFPILDYKAHLACYLVQNPNPMAHAITAIDQFGNWQLDVYQNDCLCVPALKEQAVRTEESTWGRIKALYQ